MEIKTTTPKAPVQMVMLPQTEWEAVKTKIEEIVWLVMNRNDHDAKCQWVESGEARKMLGVSQTTWQKIRDDRKIKFSQFGRKIYVKLADIESFMESHSINAKR